MLLGCYEVAGTKLVRLGENWGAGARIGRNLLEHSNVCAWLASNIVRTRTEHFEPEHFVCVQVHQLSEPNLNVQVQVRAHDPRTQTKPNPGQSIRQATQLQLVSQLIIYLILKLQSIVNTDIRPHYCTVHYESF